MNIVAIRSKAESIVAEILGASGKALPYALDLLLNDTRTLERGYAVLWGEGNEDTSQIDQRINIAQALSVSLTRRTYARNSDARAFSAMDELYSDVGQIINRFVVDRLDMSGTIQEVRLTSMGKPSPLGGADIMSIELNFQVRYLN